MSGADAVNLVVEIVGPRGQRLIAVLVAAGLVLFHDQTMHFFTWFVSERAHELTERLMSMFNRSGVAPTTAGHAGY